MFGNKSYNGEITKYVELFGYLFKDVYIERTNGSRVQTEIVPIKTGWSEKYIARNEQDPNIEKPIAIQLPILTYDLVNMYRNTNIQLNPMNTMASYSDSGTLSTYRTPTPYTFVFVLTAKARHLEDMYKIASQIIPYFTPDLTISADILGNDNPVNVTISFNSTNQIQNYEGQIGERNVLEWSFEFTMNGYIWGQNLSDGPNGKDVIRWVRTDVSNWDAKSNTVGYTITSNLYPVLANTALEDIKPTDNYTINTDITETFIAES